MLVVKQFAILIALFGYQDANDKQTQLLTTFRGEFLKIDPSDSKINGAFKYGSDKNPLKKTRIRISRKFEIAKYEIPQNLWTSVMGKNPSKWKGPRNSVEMLTFDEAVEFCNRATKLMQKAKLIETHQYIRLPTEIEWEFAARAGTDSKYSFGKTAELIKDYAWYTGNAKGNDPPVGAKKPNPWGLYDVHGYLWEWCLNSRNAKSNHCNWQTWTKKEFSEKPVLRSGSWKDSAEELASSFRKEVDKSVSDDAVGLRCVLVSKLDDKKKSQLKLANGFSPTAQDSIVDSDRSMKLLWNDGEFTEGPAPAPDGSIYFSDIGNRIMKYVPSSGKVSIFREPSGRSNGLMFDRKGRLIVCEGANTGGGQRISIIEDGKARTLSDSFDGKRFNSPNDLAIDGKGRVYFTDPRYVGKEPRELDFEGVFLIEQNGKTIVATREVTKPNGILVSLDGKSVYLADHHPSGDRKLYQFQIQKDGTLKNRKQLFDFGKNRGIDGMTLDEKGNIYATAGSKADAGIYVFSPTGRQLAFITCPGSPTNCVFGIGNHNRTLFLTAAGPAGTNKYGLYSIELKNRGLNIVPDKSK